MASAIDDAGHLVVETARARDRERRRRRPPAPDQCPGRGSGAWANIPALCAFSLREVPVSSGRTSPATGSNSTPRTMSSSTTCSPTPATDPTCPTSRTGSSSSRETSATRPPPRRRCAVRRSTRSSTSPPSRTTRWPCSTPGCSSGPTCSGPRPCSRRPARPAWTASTTSRPARSTATCRSTPTRSSTRTRPTGPARPTTHRRRGRTTRCGPTPRPTGCPITITNCANNYGPYQFPEKLIPHFCALALDDKPLTLYASTENRREWLHVVRPLHRHRRRAGPGPGGRDVPRRQRRGGVHHGGGRPHPGRPGKPESLKTIVPDRPGHDRRYVLDASKLRTRAGLGPLGGVGAGVGGHSGVVRRPTGSGGSRCGPGARRRGVLGRRSGLSGADPDHRGLRTAGPRPARRLAGRVPAGGLRCALLGPEGPRPGLNHEVLGTDIDTMRVNDRDAVLTPSPSSTQSSCSTAARSPRWISARARSTPAFAVNAVGTRHVAEAAALVGAQWSTCRPTTSSTARATVPTGSGTRRTRLGLRRLQARRRARCRPGTTIVRTWWLCGAHGTTSSDRPAPGRGRGGAALRRRPAGLADVHRRPGADGRDPRTGPRPGIFHVTNSGVTTWWGFVRRSSPRPGGPRAGAAHQHRRLDPPRPAPRPAYSVLDNMALRLSGLPALPAGRTAWPGSSPSCGPGRRHQR